MLLLEAIFYSIIGDFIVRAGGHSDIYESTLRGFPIPEQRSEQLAARVLRLVCITTHYAPLWERNLPAVACRDAWATDDERLTTAQEFPWSSLPMAWERGCALRSDFARRQALLEIDVLVAQSLNLTLDELLSIYRVQFPVLRQYEDADEYDAVGRHLPNTTRKRPGGKELRAARTTQDGGSPLRILLEDRQRPLDGDQNLYPPFSRIDREEDYRRAWAAFAARLPMQ